MAGMTRAEAEAGLAAAQDALLEGQKVKAFGVADRQYQAQNLAELRATVDWWQDQVERLTPGAGSTLQQGVPRA